MNRVVVATLILLMSGCASTQPAQDTAELASQQLLRLEAELQTAARTLHTRYEQQQQFIERHLEAAVEAESDGNELRREWQVAGNREANRLYADLLSSRPVELTLPSLVQAEKLSVDTTALKRAIKDLGAVNQSLADRNTAEAFLRFGHKVQQDYEIMMEPEEP